MTIEKQSCVKEGSLRKERGNLGRIFWDNNRRLQSFFCTGLQAAGIYLLLALVLAAVLPESTFVFLGRAVLVRKAFSDFGSGLVHDQIHQQQGTKQQFRLWHTCVWLRVPACAPRGRPHTSCSHAFSSQQFSHDVNCQLPMVEAKSGGPVEAKSQEMQTACPPSRVPDKDLRIEAQGN